MSINLSTDSNKWRYEASRDDRFFREYFASLEEATGTIEGSLVFKSSVAKIIEDQWDAAIFLTEYIDDTEEMATIYYISNPMMYLTGVMNMVPLCDPLMSGRISYHINISLKDILQISNIITLPENWRMYVPVGNGVREKDAVDHLMAVGEGVIREYERRGDYSSRRLDKFAQGSIMPLFYECISVYLDENGVDEDAGEEYHDTTMVLWTLARNAAMEKLMKDPYATAITAEDIDWNLALAYMERVGIDKESMTWNTAMAFAGRLDPLSVVHTATPSFNAHHNSYGRVDICEGKQKGLISRLHTSLIRHISPRVLLIGLQFIGGGAGYVTYSIGSLNDNDTLPPYNDVMKIPRWVHNVIATQLAIYNHVKINKDEDMEDFSIEREDYNTYIYLLDHFIAGRDLLLRLASAEELPEDEGRWSDFLSAVRKYIRENKRVEHSVLFPTPLDISRAKRLMQE